MSPRVMEVLTIEVYSIYVLHYTYHNNDCQL